MKNKLMKYIIIAVLLIIPFMYSFFYLKAFWNPYGNLKDVKVALVNLDEANNGVKKGDDFVEKLKDLKKVKFEEVGYNRAMNGLSNKKYYAVITIPKDFSKNMNNIATKNRKQTVITYSPNQKTNYLASQIISRIVVEVEGKLNTEVDSKIIRGLNGKLQEVPKNLENISEGFNTISTNLTTIDSGVKTLKSGTNKLSDGYNIFNNGLNSLNDGVIALYDGMSTFNTGMNTLSEKLDSLDTVKNKLNDLKTGVDKLNESEQSFNTGVNNYIEAVNQFANGVSLNKASITSFIEYLNSEHPELLNDSNYVNMISSMNSSDDSINKLLEKGNELKNYSHNIALGTSNLSSSLASISEINNQFDELKTGVDELNTGSNTILSSYEEIKNGTGELVNNSSEIVSGIAQVNSGLDALDSGIASLNDGIKSKKEELDTKIVDAKNSVSELDGIASFSKQPIKIWENDINKVSTYGVAFAPYFMSISLFVGALMLLMVLYYDIFDRFTIFSRNNKHHVKRFIAYLGVGILQGIVLGFLLKIGLGLEVKNILLYYVSLIVVSCVFTTILQSLIYSFGDIGKFLAILLLVLQLSASAGTFPIETTPKFFQSIYNFMPMKYTINLFKEVTIKMDINSFRNNILILIAISLIFALMMVIIDQVKKHVNND